MHYILGWIEFEFWIWMCSRVIDEFELDFCKVNEFECLNWTFDEFDFLKSKLTLC